MQRKLRAFTLLELMVTIAIIAVIVSLIFVATRGLRSAAARTDSLSALRQMSVAFSAYATDHRQRFLPGFVNEDFLDNPSDPQYIPLPTRFANGEQVPFEAAQTYVWRLAPYLDNAWETLYTDLAEQTSVVSELRAEYEADEFEELTFHPSYGMNAIFVGGASDLGGNEISNFNPWQTDNPPIAATRMSQVRNPARLIVFGPSSEVGALPPTYSDDPHNHGWHELRAPCIETSEVFRMWHFGDGGEIMAGADLGMGGQEFSAGLPISRTGDENLPIAFVDGHAEMRRLSDISVKMELWDPFADPGTVCVPSP